MKLNGWYRLWIVLSVVFLGLGVLVAAVAMPDYSSIPHDASFYDSLSDAAKAQLASEDAADAIQVEMPDHHLLRIKSGTELEKTTPIVVVEYMSMLDRARLRKRVHFALTIGAVWLSACTTLLAAGLSVAWVRRGFIARAE
jgi:hypothetical protein